MPGPHRQPSAMKDEKYSEVARKARYQATVVVNLTVSTDETPTEMCVDRIAGLGLDKPEVAAVRKWKFEPAMKNEEPVPTRINTEVEFRLY